MLFSYLFFPTGISDKILKTLFTPRIVAAGLSLLNLVDIIQI